MGFEEDKPTATSTDKKEYGLSDAVIDTNAAVRKLAELVAQVVGAMNTDGGGSDANS